MKLDIDDPFNPCDVEWRPVKKSLRQQDPHFLEMCEKAVQPNNLYEIYPNNNIPVLELNTTIYKIKRCRHATNYYCITDCIHNSKICLKQHFPYTVVFNIRQKPKHYK